MSEALVAQLGMREFDPSKERHRPLLIVKSVDPGCTLELQIENCVTGEVTRLTTGDSDAADRVAFEKAVVDALRKAWVF